MDLIDRAAAVSRISDLLILDLKGARLPTWNEVYNAIGEIPAVEAVPMRRTKPVVASSLDCNWYQCGNCESIIDQGDRYCRGCGAEVDWDGTIT